jgi:hypothetical protein
MDEENTSPETPSSTDAIVNENGSNNVETDEASTTNKSSAKVLISFTVKTLDSQDHKIVEVDDEISFKDLKSNLADIVGIIPERQRLIYCGKVLHDDKKLKEYSLNGKVIHLVQRKPPT